ncbi:MAG: 5-methyltetrahydrofolate--homocysteine methyltransferase [Bacteroides sp.]|nr:5-methyltetrahydrofolate--homocysteine methyltransferase [Bacteroides sp.]
MITSYAIHEVTSYIDWVYFFHAWGFQRCFAAIANIHGCDVCRATWLTTFPEEDRAKAAEAMQLFKEANRMLNQLDQDYKTHNILMLCEANSEGDNLWLNGIELPLLRQQTKSRKEEAFLCLSDFVRPLSSGIKDEVGVFASSVDPETEQLYLDDPYKRMLVQTLSDRLAEATTEKMHRDLKRNRNADCIRPAVGYPSLPDLSVNFILNEIIDMKRIGITLTENGMMRPHSSVSGLLFFHPAAHYFPVGKIGEDQLKDYANRRGMDIEIMRKYLSGNLAPA